MFPGESKSIVQSVKEYFVPPPEPKELVRKWQADIRREQRGLERQIRENTRLEKTAQKQIKDAAKAGDMATAKVLAKELIHTRKVTTRLYTNKAHMMSMNSQLTEQLGMVKVAGTLKKSTQVMTTVNQLMKVPQLNQAMQQMSREMMKAGMIDEMMEEAMDDAMDTEDMEEETEVEVEKVLAEIGADTAAAMQAPGRSRVGVQQATPQEQEQEDSQVEELQARLNAVRS